MKSGVHRIGMGYDFAYTLVNISLACFCRISRLKIESFLVDLDKSSKTRGC